MMVVVAFENFRLVISNGLQALKNVGPWNKLYVVFVAKTHMYGQSVNPSLYNSEVQWNCNVWTLK